jgi:RNA polymerase sigma-70 factor (ECF subfamily)
MAPQEPDTDQLLQRACQGDLAACQELLVRHQERLRKMIALRMDRRLAARIDPSDVVQEAIVKVPGMASRTPYTTPPHTPWIASGASTLSSCLVRVPLPTALPAQLVH